jgi:mRNA interferase MazF
MTDSVQRWGNSLAVRIPHRVARQLGLRERSGVRLQLEGRRLVIEPLSTPLTLDRLLADASVKLPWRWTPGRGDVVSVKTAGDVGRRPALVLSPAAYSARTGFAICCPIEEKAGPFAVEVPSGLPVRGAIPADGVMQLHVLSCAMSNICSVPDEVVTAVLERLAVLVDIGSEL